MIPTDLLKTELEAIGFPVVWERWHPDYSFLVAYLDDMPSPNDVASRLQQVLGGNDSKLFYDGPNRKPGRVGFDGEEVEDRGG
jgi:hypothetical protein